MSADIRSSGSIVQRRIGMHGSRFAWIAATVGIVAAAASVITVGLSLKLWPMFIGWTCFGTGGGDLRRGAAAIACLVIGVLLGMGGVVVLGAIQPVAGEWALPIVIFGLAVLAMLTLLTPPLDAIPGYFLGMTAFFASGLPPGEPALAAILPAALIGGLAAALVVAAPRLYDRWWSSPAERT
ncbi:MAG: DUF1097 domain-containing protein [Steroidobacteraceae bacterium]|nr:DUF1097 domain-containing protein [Steroidobacteraceae bacterium]